MPSFLYVRDVVSPQVLDDFFLVHLRVDEGEFQQVVEAIPHLLAGLDAFGPHHLVAGHPGLEAEHGGAVFEHLLRALQDGRHLPGHAVLLGMRHIVGVYQRHQVAKPLLRLAGVLQFAQLLVLHMLGLCSPCGAG